MAKQVNNDELRKEFLRYLSVDFSKISKKDIPAVNWILDQKGFPEHRGRVVCKYGMVANGDKGKGIILEYTAKESGDKHYIHYDRRTIDRILDHHLYLTENAMIEKPKDTMEISGWVWLQ